MSAARPLSTGFDRPSLASGASREAQTAGLREQLQHVARNLMSLEVNTIIKDGMTATGMPSTGQALIDIVNDYDAKLRELGTVPDSTRNGVASLVSFEELRERAQRIHSGAAGARRADVDYTQGTLLMLCRIRDNSAQLTELFNALDGREGRVFQFTRASSPSIALPPAELMLVRKIWEIGTEEIVMQTVIQLDGDIVTRMQKTYAKLKDDPLVAVHNSAVATSVGTWNKLVDTLGAFMKGVTDLVHGA